MVSRERFVMRLMCAIGAPSDDLRLGLCVTEEEEARLDAALADHGLDLAGLEIDPPIVIAPGAGYGPSKCWPAESFAQLADGISRRGRRVILLGGPGEGSILDAVTQAMTTKPIVLDAVLDLGSLKALIRSTRALVVNDAGTRHVAAAFGIEGLEQRVRRPVELLGAYTEAFA